MRAGQARGYKHKGSPEVEFFTHNESGDIREQKGLAAGPFNIFQIKKRGVSMGWDNVLDPKWDKRFLGLAKHIAQWSKDPSTKCGAVIAHEKRVIGVGFNGFPQKVEDTDERYRNREIKYKIVLHSEENALQFAPKHLKGCTLYNWPMPPCSHCAGLIIQSGIISCVITPRPTEEQQQRWGQYFELTSQLFKEAGIDFILV